MFDRLLASREERAEARARANVAAHKYGIEDGIAHLEQRLAQPGRTRSLRQIRLAIADLKRRR